MQRRLLLSNVVTTVLFLLILGLVALLVGAANLQRQVEEGHRRLAVLVAKDVNARYSGIVETVELLGNQLEREVYSPFEQAQAMKDLRLASPLTYRALYLFESVGYPLIGVAGPVEELAARPVEESIAPPPAQIPDGVMDALMHTGQGGMFTSPVQIVGADRVPVLYLGVPLAAGGGNGQSLVVEVDLRSLWQRVDEVYAGRAGRALVASGDGIIIAHPDRAYIGEPLPLPLRPVLEGYEGEARYTDPIGGQVMLAAYSPVGKQSGWSVVVEQEYAQALAPLRTIALATFGVLLIAAVMAVAITIFIGQTITRPLQRLEAATQAIAQTGDIERQVAVDTQDEVGRLADAFDRMLASLREREARLRKARQMAHKQAQELAILNKLGLRISASLSLEQVVQVALEGITDAAHPDLALLFLREGDRLILQGTYAGDPRYAHLEMPLHRVGECLCGLAVSQRQSLYSADIYSDPRCTWEECKKAGLRSLAALPLRSGDEIVGVLGLASRTARHFEEQARFLETLANEVAIGVQNARLYEAAQRRWRELSTLYSASQVFARSLDPENIGQELIKTMEQLLGYTYGAVLVVDESTQTLVPLALSDQGQGPDFVKQDKEYIRGQQLCVGDGIVGWVARHGQVVRVGDVRQDDRYFAVREDIRSEMCVPLVVGEKIIGVLNVETGQPDAYDEDDERLLTALAGPAAVAIENARLFAQVRRYSEELEQRVAERTAELNARVAEVERLNRALADMLEDLQAANRNLEATTARLEEVNQELDDFAYVVSHDLKAPLRGISQLATWIVEDYSHTLDDEGQRKLHLLVDRVKRMHALIDGVLRYSRAGRAREQARPVDLNQLVRDVIESLAPPAHIRVSVENELPLVVGEPTRLAQVFQNLVDNAIKFVDKPEGRVTIECADEGTLWRFSVADNGPGIEQRHRDRIFRLFQTLAPRSDPESTGVGLALVKRIVEMNGGQVWVESTIGEGSTFHFTWPKEQGEGA